MTRGKTQAGFIENRRKRRQSFATRSTGLLNKAEKLDKLCGVPVAVVCADLEGGAPPTVLETQAGVLDRYRALPAHRRAEHTHLRYLENLLTKERAKLAKMRQAGPYALAPPHEQMSRMTLEELRRLDETIDATWAAVAERRRALGLPGDDDAVVVPCGDSGPSTAGSSEGDDGYFYPMQQGQGDANIDHGLLDQGMIWQGLQAHGGGGMIPHEYYGYHPEMNMLMQPAYDPQFNVGHGATHMGGYQQQMPSNDGYYLERIAPGASFQPQYTIAQPEHGGFQYDNGISSHVGTSSSWMVPSNGNFNNGAVVHDLSIWSAGESSNAFAGYPYMHTSGNTPAAGYADQFTGNNYLGAPAEFLDIGVGGSGMNYLGGYETQGSSNDLQYSAASQNSSSVKELFEYGSDD